MAVLTGTSGELRYHAVRVGKCREVQLEIQRDTLETTVLGQWDRSYSEGLRGASGSTTLLYDQDDTSTRDLLNSIFRNDDGAQGASIVLNTQDGTSLDLNIIVTSVGTPIRVGEVIACSVNFQVSGAISGGF